MRKLSQSNFYFPWELQIWEKKDVQSNIQAQMKHKREKKRRIGLFFICKFTVCKYAIIK